MLTTVVVVFAVNLTTSETHQEKLFIASTHVWYVNSTTSVAAIELTDTGPSSAVLTKVEVNGLQCSWNGNDSYVNYCEVNGTFNGDLPFQQLSNSANTTVAVGNQQCVFAPAIEGLTVKSGNSIAFYAELPNCILVYNLATPVNIVVSTSQTVYCTQTIVQST